MLTGFKTKLDGTAVGEITGLKEAAVGGFAINMINSQPLDSENGLSLSAKGGVTGGKITATVIFEKAMYDLVLTAAKNDVAETFTLEDVEGNVWAGLGWISNVSQVRMTSGGENVFDIEITPETEFAYTKKAAG